MRRFPQRFALSTVACALVMILGLAAWALASEPSEAQTGLMQDCPPAGMWSIAVWDGESGTAAADALATCGEGAVGAAYSLDAQTGVWSRWFAGKPGVSDLPSLADMQGVLALGSAAIPTPTPTPTATPTPLPGAPELGAWSGTTSQGKPIDFEVVEDSPGSRAIRQSEWRYDGCRIVTTVYNRWPIVNNTFSDTDGDVSGVFDSPTTASGDLHIQAEGCGSDPVTWTASLQ